MDMADMFHDNNPTSIRWRFVSRGKTAKCKHAYKGKAPGVAALLPVHALEQLRYPLHLEKILDILIHV